MNKLKLAGAVIGSIMLVSSAAVAAIPSSANMEMEFAKVDEAPKAGPKPVQLALASSCNDPWYTMSGIQFITCMLK